MREIIFYLDFVSPYAWLAFEQLPQALEGIDCHVTYRPVSLGALLKHEGSMAAVTGKKKRAWMYRHVTWLAQQQGLALQMPAKHPFNSLPLLRLAQQCTFTGETNRWVTELLFRHVWQSGQDAEDQQRLQALHTPLARFLDVDPTAPERARLQLRSMTQQAMDAGAFGVPALVCEGKMFWGLEALPMLRSYLLGQADWDEAHWQRFEVLPASM